MAKSTDTTIFKTWEDGFRVRKMSADDAKIAQTWFGTLCPTSCDLEVALSVAESVFGADCRYFYVGEYDGEIVASVVRLPVTEGIFYGSYYYVVEKHRGKRFGCRLRDECAVIDVGDNIVAIDAHDNLLEMNKRRGYTESFRVDQFSGKPKLPVLTDQPAWDIKMIDEVKLTDLINYDKKCFVKPYSKFREELIKRWTKLEQNCTVIAVNNENAIIGYGCRRAAFQTGNHLIGPLYADSYDVALHIMSELCTPVKQESVLIDVCSQNTEAVKLAETLGLKEGIKMIRMYLNGDPNEYNPNVFGLTSVDVCGF